MSRVMLVGESNPLSDDPAMALYPAPRGCAGWRLCHVVLGMPSDDYLDTFVRRNLLRRGEAWNPRLARARAELLMREAQARGIERVILLGRRVAQAFGAGKQVAAFTVGQYVPDTPPPTLITLAYIPHPSGRCRTWNEPGSVERARACVRELLEASKRS